MINKFLRLIFSKPLLTLRLAKPRRIKNAIIFLFKNKGNLPQLYKRYQDIYTSSDNIQIHDELIECAKRMQCKKDIFIFPIIDWSFRHQRPQHLALALGKLGYRVFYFSTTPLMGGGEKAYQVIEQPSENVFLCKLNSFTTQIDDIHQDEMANIIRDAYQSSLSSLMIELKTDSPVLVLNHPYWYPLAKLFPGFSLGYDCMDHHAAFQEETFEGVMDNELELIRNADFVVTSSSYLSDKVGQIKENTIIRNGCEYEFFSGVEQWKPSKKPVAGYVGAIAEWFDIDLIISVAKKLPHWDFLLIGSTSGCDISRAKKCTNIIFVGEVAYEVLPDYLKRFDVCMIPFKLTELTKATNPVKVYEYLAAGRAVVSSALPEILLLNDKVFVANDSDAFVDQLQLALASMHDSQLVDSWKQWAAEQDWLIRAKMFEKTMHAKGDSPVVN